ncbi:MAG: neutral/alkaline non-lysosomal ceramidase N-terminal domain-containing protein [Propionibacteriales bacterium]|nr:neutral/alkaline non-lysosomal ceramidase N-terminal domain-containing protein [Propionibacteriales bacterium]
MSALGDLHALIGFASREITPPLATRWKLWGAATATTAAGVHRPLIAAAMAVTTDDQRIVIVSLDVCEWADAVDELTVRAQIAHACQLSPDQVLLHSTHTHSGQAPCLRQADLAGGEHFAEHLTLISDRAADAAQAAMAAAQPATLSWGAGRCSLASYRDELRDGRAVVGYEPSVPADDSVGVGRVTDAGGSVIGVIVSYACHPTVLGWANRLISPDYVGAMRDLIATEYPHAITVFLQGASGELAPARQYRSEPADADRAGRALGHAVLATIELMPAPGHRLTPTTVVESGAPLGVWDELPVASTSRLRTRRLDLALPRKAEPLTLPDELPAHVRAEREARAELVRLNAGGDSEVPYSVWIWELGNAVLIAHPGEAYSWLAHTVRAALAPRPVIIANLTNGGGAFYLPPRSAYAHPSYTVAQTPVGAGSLELLSEAVLTALGVTASSPSLQPTIQES